MSLIYQSFIKEFINVFKDWYFAYPHFNVVLMNVTHPLIARDVHSTADLYWAMATALHKWTWVFGSRRRCYTCLVMPLSQCYFWQIHCGWPLLAAFRQGGKCLKVRTENTAVVKHEKHFSLFSTKLLMKNKHKCKQRNSWQTIWTQETGSFVIQILSEWLFNYCKNVFKQHPYRTDSVSSFLIHISGWSLKPWSLQAVYTVGHF